jgi:methylenetetrahydrofolate reductase (NADPH)
MRQVTPEEGRRIAIEIVQAVRDIPGVAGVHIMAHRQEKLVRSIVADSGVLAQRVPLFTDAPAHGIAA